MDLSTKFHNVKLSKPIRLLLALLLVVILSFLFVSNPMRNLSVKGMDRLPPEAGDGVDYEHLANNIFEGRGYVIHWDDPEWKAPYLPYQNHPMFRGIVERTGTAYVTAYRPPLYPMFLALVYEMTGRNFYFARLFNFILFFLSVLIVVCLSVRCFGIASGIAVLALAYFDSSLSFWSSYLLTEPLATFLATVLMALLMRYRESRTPSFALFVGLMCGLLVLTRSITLLWLPFVLVVVAYGRVALRLRVVTFSAFSVGLIAPLSIWAARNITQIDASAALGTQSGVNFAVDYSDYVMKSRGVWTGPTWNAVQAPFRNDPQLGTLRGTAREIAANHWGREQGFRWIANNPGRLAELFWIKFQSLWWRHIGPFHLSLAVVSIAALFFVQRKELILVPFTLIVANTFAVVMTHNVPAGRFLMPIVPCLYFLCGATAHGIIAAIRRKKEGSALGPTFRAQLD